MKINSYDSQILNFGNSPKISSNDGFNKFSLSQVYQNKYKNTYCKDIIPDLFEYISKTKTLKESDIKSIIGHGGLSLVFDLGDEVLKGSLENPLEFRKHNPHIDIPFLSPVEKVGNTYFVREAKADTKNINKEDCFNILKQIHKLGLEPSRDFDGYSTEQIGKYQGRTYLLDTRCAVPRPNRFSRFIYDFKTFNSRVIKVMSLSNNAITKRENRQTELIELVGPQILHIDEKPRPNLSFKRGLALIRGVMKRNRNAGLSAVDIRAVIFCIIRAITK